MSEMRIDTRDFDKAIKALEKTQGQIQKVADRVLSDFKTRAPGWVASEVVKEYGIKKAEVTPAKVGKNAGGKSAGTVGVRGESLGSMAIVYRGRPLTPTHFGMTPTVPKASYTLKAQIIKGKKATLGKKKKLTKKQRTNLAKNFRGEGTKTSTRSPIMLMHTGAGSADKTQYIPFQRVSKNRNDLKAIKTVSLPQMVGGERTRENIDRVLNEQLGKRLDHHMKLLEK